MGYQISFKIFLLLFRGLKTVSSHFFRGSLLILLEAKRERERIRKMSKPGTPMERIKGKKKGRRRGRTL
jgi:hypothetical protein